MDVEKLYKLWCEKATEDPDLAEELKDLDRDGIYDRFYRNLEFGTGGLRGVIGAGTNRMNIYTVRKATQGLANYLKAHGGRSVAIAYDSRIKSDLFATEAARVLAANGIKVYIYPRLEPTPALSWAVRYFKTDAGICVTASHNPSKYNGYKVYGSDGCQITLDAAEEILFEIGKVDEFEVDVASMDSALADTRIEYIGESCINGFVDAVYSKRVGDGDGIGNLKLVYTPLNGTGRECVTKLFEKLGLTNYTIVKEQEMPDGNFPTCPYPNPEIKEAMKLGLRDLEATGADLLLGTDPDADRCGAAVPDGKGGYRLITGNEMGVLLLDFVARMRRQQKTMPARPVAVTTIVSTDMVDELAAKYSIDLRRVLTGFKFIGEQIASLEQNECVDDFIFGFEESYGYLSSSHVRDKDAVNASLLIVEAAAYYKKLGMSLLDAMNALYEEYGYYRNDLLSFTFEGASGMNFMQEKMASLRTAPPKEIAGRKVEAVVDYSKEGTGLPKANVLEFRLEGKAKLMVRPSGTEPKIKVYLSAKGITEKESIQIIELLKEAGDRIING